MQQVTRNLKRGDEAVAAGGVASESAAAIPSGQQRWRTRRNGGSVSAAVSVWAGKQARSFSCLVQFGQMQTPRRSLSRAGRRSAPLRLRLRLRSRSESESRKRARRRAGAGVRGCSSAGTFAGQAAEAAAREVHCGNLKVGK